MGEPCQPSEAGGSSLDPLLLGWRSTSGGGGGEICICAGEHSRCARVCVYVCVYIHVYIYTRVASTMKGASPSSPKSNPEAWQALTS